MNFFYPAIISILIAGCAGNSTVQTNVETKAKTNSTEINSTTAINKTANANSVIQNESNARTSDTKLRSGGVINQESFEALERLKNSDANAAPMKNAAPVKNAAPDNSVISSAMNSEGVPIETRTFKNNPLLVKTEKILADPANPTLKVYLKNGKIISFPASRISDSVSASANEILTAAGAVTKDAPSENDSKKRAN